MAKRKRPAHVSPVPAADKDFIAFARKRFDLAESFQKNQRQRELDDLRFYAGDQWPADTLTSRTAQPAGALGKGSPSVPARPSLTINKTRAPIRQVLNEERQADFGIKLVPADDFAAVEAPPDDTEVELREGLIRRLQRDSIASDARTWAFSRACIAGQGFYRVNLRWVPGTWDREITVERIFNQSSVTLDPRHEQPDGSDAEYEFIGTDISWEEYKAEFPDSKESPNYVTRCSDEEFRTLGDEAPGWFTDEKDVRSVRVVEYFYIDRTSTAVERPITLADGSTDKETRQDIIKTIKWVKMDGCQVLDRTEWQSPFMPIVKVLGEELHPYDNERRMEGMVRPAMDAARGFNYMVSRQVESVGLAPLPPWMIQEGSIEGYEDWYAQANTRPFPYLYFKARDLYDNPVIESPKRINPDVPIEAISRSVAMFDQAIQATTMVPDPTLGHNDPSLRSGKAVERLVAQSQRGTSNYLDNLTRSMTYEAKIENSLLYPVYGTRPGRLTSIMTGPQGMTQTAQIGGEPGKVNGRQPPKVYQLSPDAKFNIAIKVTKNYDTTRQEESAILGEMITNSPNLMTVFGDKFFANLDTPDHKEIAKRAELMLAPPIQQMLSGKTPIPPALQDQMAKAQQMIDDLSKELQAKTKIIETESIKAQQELLINEQDNATKIEVAKIQAGAALAVADLKASADQILASAKSEIEQMRLIVEAAEESRLRREEALKEAATQHRDQSHEAVMAGVAHAHDRIAAEHDAALERQNLSHEAAVMPAPEPAAPAQS